MHADHVTAAWLHKQKLGSRIGISKASGAEGADLYLEKNQIVHFGKKSLEALPTPGHTAGCMTYVLDDRSMAFTGDALLIRGCGRTDFQGGSPAALFRSVREQVFSLPEGCLIYPAHTTAPGGEQRGEESTTRAWRNRSARAKRRLQKTSASLIPSRWTWLFQRIYFVVVHKSFSLMKTRNGPSTCPSQDLGQPTGSGKTCATSGHRRTRADEFNGSLGHVKGEALPLDPMKMNSMIDPPVVVVCRLRVRHRQRRSSEGRLQKWPTSAALRWRAQRFPGSGND